MTGTADQDPVRDLADMPLRLWAAAQAIADQERAALGFPAADLATVSEISFRRFVGLARAALDAAAAAGLSIGPQLGVTAAAIERIAQVKAATVALRAQGVVLIDIAQDGEVRVNTWTAAAGTPAEALAEWGRGLWGHALSAVPFRTVFGMGRNGVPTPLTPAERASLGEAGRAYADRYEETRS